jgi:hypothetical protein
MCTVQIAYGVIWPPDRLTIEYPTCATISGPLHQVFYSCHNPHRCPPCCTCHLHTMRQANMILHTKQRIKVKQWTILDLNSNLAKLITHHNQTKELFAWFLNAFNATWTALHTLKERIHVLRKWPQDIPTSPNALGARSWLIARQTRSSYRMIGTVLKQTSSWGDRSEIHITRQEDTHLLILS